MPSTIFTIGYEKRSLSEYVSILRDAEIDIIVDVRETAWSHKPGFSKSAFSAGLEAAGIQYVHASFAGNPKWMRREAATHKECLDLFAGYLDASPFIVDRLEEVIAEYSVEGQSIALTCFERHNLDCHRSNLASAWVDRSYGRTVEHMAIDGCARLVRS